MTSSSPSPPTPLQTETVQEDDDPEQRAVRQGFNKRAARARELMANKYEKRHEVTEFEPGDYYTIQVPKKDRPSGASATHILYKVLQRKVTFTRFRRSTAFYAQVMQLKP